MAGGLSMVVYDFTGTVEQDVLAQFSDTTTVGFELDEVGETSFSLNAASPSATALAAMPAALLRIREGASDVGWAWLNEDDHDPADSSGQVTFGAHGIEYVLSFAKLKAVTSGDTNYTILRLTPGQALRVMLSQCRARGTLDGVHGPLVTLSCTDVVDSANVPWPETVWLQYALGTSYLDVLRDLVSKGFIDFRMRGTVLDLFVNETAMAQTFPNAMLHLRRDITSAPLRNIREGRVSSLTVQGEQASLFTTVEDSTALAAIGRVEGFDQQGGVSDFPTLAVIAQYLLQQQKDTPQALTIDYSRSSKYVPDPVRGDYALGGYVFVDSLRSPFDQTYLPQRVRSISLTWETDGSKSCEVELNDLALEADVKLARAVSSLLVSSSPTNPTGQPVGPDSTIPNPVPQVSVSTTAVVGTDGRPVSYATATWAPVTQNTDGSTFDDLGSYYVSYRIGVYPPQDTTTGWSGDQATQQTEAGLAGFPPGTTVQARVTVSDSSSHQAATYTLSAPVVCTGDNAAPNAPDAPTVTPLIAGILVDWDGNDTAGVPMPVDFDHVEVHVSTVPNFTASAATVADTAGGPPAYIADVITGLQVGIGYYVRLVSVDTSGNRSPQGSIAGPVQPRQIGGGEINPYAIANTDHSGRFPGATTLAGTGTTVVNDGATYTGKSLQVPAGKRTTGPAYTALAPGRYRATFRVSSDTASASAGCTIDATGTNIVEDTSGTQVAFQAANAYILAAVRFQVTATGSTLNLVVAGLLGNTFVDIAYVEPIDQIAIAEIGDAQVGNLSATKLTAGVVSAILTISGRIATAVSGARVELNAGGIFAYDSTGTQTVAIRSNGSAAFSGTITGSTIDSTSTIQGATVIGSVIETAATGPRVVIGPNPVATLNFGNTQGIAWYGNYGSAQAPAAIGYAENEALGNGSYPAFLTMQGGSTARGYNKGGVPASITLTQNDLQNGNTVDGRVELVAGQISLQSQTTAVAVSGGGPAAFTYQDNSATSNGAQPGSTGPQPSGVGDLHSTTQSMRLGVPGPQGTAYVQTSSIAALYGDGSYVLRPLVASNLSASSTEAHKDEIVELADHRSRLHDVRTVRFRRIGNAGWRTDGVEHEVGFTHENVYAVMPEAAPVLEPGPGMDEPFRGVDPFALLASLWRDVQRLDVRVAHGEALDEDRLRSAA